MNGDIWGAPDLAPSIRRLELFVYYLLDQFPVNSDMTCIVARGGGILLTVMSPSFIL